MDKRATLIILKDEKAARKYCETKLLSKNFKRAILEKRLGLLENEYDNILTELEKEE
jgi:hypothetical protein